MAMPLRSRLVTERGAVLVPVATVLLVFTALSGFLVNLGLHAVSRTQAQTAVDAAALAAATALAFDSYTDRSVTGPAAATAMAVARENLVLNEPASTEAADVTFPVCESTYQSGPSGTPIMACVEVSAYRTAARGNAIPTMFASFLGVSSFDIAARAVAEAKDANTTDCLKPLAIPDRWTERYPTNPGTWSPASTFDRYDPANPSVLLPPTSRDAYTAPDQISAGTGLRTTVEFGAQVTLQEGALGSPIAPISPWRYLPVQIPDSRWGANDMRANTSGCAAAPVSIGDELWLAPGGVPANAAAAAEGLRDLIAADPDAYWNTTAQRVEGSCADRLTGRCASMSPRIIALPVYDVTALADASQAALPTRVRVRNVVGFFIESVSGTSATGRITRHPGQIDPTAITLYDASSFLRAALLVQ